MFNWHKKEKPILGYGGFGGGASGIVLGAAASDPIDATGGSKSPTSRSGYIVHTFSHPNGSATSPHPATFTVNSGSGTIEYMILGGGAGGNHLGGGGAGGLLESTADVAPGDYAITVGHGGAKGNWTGGVIASAGGNSSIGSLGKNATAYGGGIGALNPSTGGNGGSGGGANANSPQSPGGFGLNPNTPAPVISSFPEYTPGTLQGGNGGAGNENGPSPGHHHGGGGGGAYGPGAGDGGVAPDNAPSSGNDAAGGSGRNVSITGSTVQYGGGGGGGAYGPGSGGYKSNGGAGGGGRGGHGATGGEPGTNGLGGGGGGAGSNPHLGSPGGGGRGGNGIVIIAYEQ